MRLFFKRFLYVTDYWLCYLCSPAPDGESSTVTEKDLEHLLNLLGAKEGEMAWQNMMERSTSNMAYQAWRHEPEVRIGGAIDTSVLQL